MDASVSQTSGRPVPVDWPNSDSEEVHWVNAIALQLGKGAIIISFGQAAPPLIGGPSEKAFEQLQALESVEATVLGKYVLTFKEASELVANLQIALRTAEQQESRTPTPRRADR